MSLHLGNLSSHITRDDLERVFRRFGRCTIQIRDRYGFVVYDYPAVAEKALKTLRGKRICGEPITISWSKRQPRAPQRSTRGGKSYVPQHRRYSRNENDDQQLGSNGRRDSQMHNRQTDDDDKKFGSSDVVDEETRHHPNAKPQADKKDHISFNDFHEAGGIERNHVEDDRWGEHVVDSSNENGLENGLFSDRYEPYHSDEKKEQDEENRLDGLPTIRKSLDKVGTRQNFETLDHANTQKSRKGCYICGEVDHKMNTCTQKPKRFAFGSRGRQHPANDDVSIRRQKGDWEPSTSRNHQRLPRQTDSPVANRTARDRKYDNEKKKRNRIDHDNFEIRRSKKSKGKSLSSGHSDYTESRSKSPSRSLRSLSGSPSHSKSKLGPSGKPSCSRSSTSHHFESKTDKLDLRSRSKSPISLTSAHCQPSSFSPDKEHIDHDTSVVNAAGPVFNKDLFETELPKTGGDISSPENISSAMGNEDAAGPPKEEEKGMEKYLSHRDDALDQSISRGLYEELDIQKSGNGDDVADNMLVHTVKEMEEPPKENVTIEHGLAGKFDVPRRSNVANSMRMSTEEMYMVLKHYGLERHVEDEKNLSVGFYFGSARLWPWQIIYYRRLKKGPIAAENYARRIAQNEEFGIVDKYIRGSSGWGQLSEDSP